MSSSRRTFLRQASSYAAGFCALRQCVHSSHAADATTAKSDIGYGELIPDPEGLLDLPRGFTYKIVSRAGAAMDDGLYVPGKADGMAAFAGPDGLAIIVRNHELLPFEGPSPFGEIAGLPSFVDAAKLYDAGRGKSPHRGGTTTLVFDPRKQEVIRQFMSLAG
ncbi:MAG TPA: DUF839 domain-containing protein, partial [Lacipirellulaceae bacterium]|nr:DUF839 domain-containing protein [Lacipirellulaceae bacterium]